MLSMVWQPSSASPGLPTLRGSHLTIKKGCFAWSTLATGDWASGVSAACPSSWAPERGRALPPQFVLQWHNPERLNTCCVWHKPACPTCADLHWLDRREVAADSYEHGGKRTMLCLNVFSASQHFFFQFLSFSRNLSIYCCMRLRQVWTNNKGQP